MEEIQKTKIRRRKFFWKYLVAISYNGSWLQFRLDGIKKPSFGIAKIMQVQTNF